MMRLSRSTLFGSLSHDGRRFGRSSRGTSTRVPTGWADSTGRTMFRLDMHLRINESKPDRGIPDARRRAHVDRIEPVASGSSEPGDITVIDV